MRKSFLTNLQFKERCGRLMDNQRLRIGFIATRLSGTDGVSLETNKWVDILQGLRHECFCFCGESDWPAERVHMVPEAHMKHPEILKCIFGNDILPPTHYNGIL